MCTKYAKAVVKKIIVKIKADQIPLFYRVDDDGIPHGWVKVMKEAIKSTAPLFSARRMLKEYAKKFYQNALKSAGE